MDVIGELHDLQKKAVLFATETDRAKRWRCGFWVEHEAHQLDRKYNILDGLNQEAKVELSAILKVVFDFLLYDKLEDEDWILALPDHYHGSVSDVVTETRKEGLKYAS